MEGDQHLIPLSALQHYAYCPRQCALIHLEQAWSENWFTAQGQLLHQRVDNGEPETRRGIRFERGVLVNAPELGLTGKLDLLELEKATGRYTPVEYKRGKPKIEDWDRIQLCAQGLCLEEMLNTPIEAGALWYWQTRHREEVALDKLLRQKTMDVIEAVRKLFDSKLTPAEAAKKQWCRACSLIDLCQPELLRKDQSSQYIDALFRD